jgi:Rne/Rng family ribonuclease
MASKMLIDAAHPEETRVVAVKGNRVEEFDYESANKKQLRGNIYLAKVTRVEPSLQAAFVDYGGNRHGFLAFTEIHPDYYQIPVAGNARVLGDGEIWLLSSKHSAAERCERHGGHSQCGHEPGHDTLNSHHPPPGLTSISAPARRGLRHADCAKISSISPES